MEFLCYSLFTCICIQILFVIIRRKDYGSGGIRNCFSVDDNDLK